MPKVAIKAVDLTKRFGEGDAVTLAVRGVSFEAYFGEISTGRGTFRQRQDHHAQHDFRNPAAQ